MSNSRAEAPNMQISVLPVGDYRESATSSSISSEASEKRNRTASQQHTLIRYRDECSRACSVLCAVFVASVRAIISLPRGHAQNQEAEGLSFFLNVPRASEHFYML